MDKLAAFREAMKVEELDGYLVPMADEFQNEYVPTHARRLEWLTGFTGSAGFAVVLKDQAAFFTDGRYTLQAKEQVSDDYERFNSTEKKPDQWVGEVMSEGDVLGYDPWLHTESEIKRFDAAAEKTGFSLKPVDNIIDPLWKDRPDSVHGDILNYNIQYSGQSTEEKKKFIINDLRSNNAEAIVLTQPESICWLLNIRGNDLPHTPIVLSYAIVDEGGVVTLYSGSDYDGAKPLREIAAGIEELAGKQVQIDPSQAPVWFIDQLEKSGATVIRAEDPCLQPKACKNDVEIAGMRAAHVRDGAALCKFLHWLEGAKDVTEISASEKLAGFRAEGELFQGLSFDTIAGYGPNGAIVHYHANEKSNRKIEPGSLLLLDSGGQYLDGTTDVTRTIAIGEPTEEQKRRFTQVLKGHIALALSVFPDGTTGSQLDAIARYALWQDGVDYDHGTGHGVGHFLNVHEGPQGISKYHNNVALKPGMVLSNEPGYYKAGEYGIRIENLVTVIQRGDLETKKPFYGFETLTMAPIDLKLVESDLLTSEELAWLNSYHQKVFETLSPLVDDEIKEWLEAVTVKR